MIDKMVVRKVIRKKKKNETKDALNKVMGGKELEIAAVILKELAERKKRKNKIKSKEKELQKIPQNKPKPPEIDNNKKRLKELSELNKMGIISNGEFEKLKKDLV